MQQVTEECVIDFVSNNGQTTAMGFPVDEKQKEIGISSYLVYLGGLCLVEQLYGDDDWKSFSIMSLDEKASKFQNNPTILPRLQQRFQELQQRYFSLMNKKNSTTSLTKEHTSINNNITCIQKQQTYYRFSPRIWPNKQQMTIIIHTVDHKIKTMETLAKEAARALLLEDSSGAAGQDETNMPSNNKSRKQKKSRRDCKKKTEKSQKVERPSKSSQVDKQLEAKTNNSLDIAGERIDDSLCDLIHHQLWTLNNNDDRMEIDENEWIQVSKKGNNKRTDDDSTLLSKSNLYLNDDKNVDMIVTQFEHENDSNISNKDPCEEQDSSTTPSEKSVPANINTRVTEADKIRHDENELQRLSKGDNGSTIISGISSTETTTILCSRCENELYGNKSAAKKSSVEEEKRLAEFENELITEIQREHVKELQKERRQYEDLIQALQLRLYISETKLKTYLDALENHNMAVSIHTTSTNAQQESCNNNDFSLLQTNDKLLTKKSYSISTNSSSTLIGKVLQGKKCMEENNHPK